MAYHRYEGVSTRSVCIFNTYGPRFHGNDGRVISNFMMQALRGEDLSDEIEGIMGLSRTDEHLPVNVGSQCEWTVLECARAVLRVTGSKSRIVHRALPQDDPSRAASTGHLEGTPVVRLGTKNRSRDRAEFMPESTSASALKRLTDVAGSANYSRAILRQRLRSFTVSSEQGQGTRKNRSPASLATTRNMLKYGVHICHSGSKGSEIWADGNMAQEPAIICLWFVRACRHLFDWERGRRKRF
jgi:hypothetical protein